MTYYNNSTALFPKYYSHEWYIPLINIIHGNLSNYKIYELNNKKNTMELVKSNPISIHYRDVINSHVILIGIPIQNRWIPFLVILLFFILPLI